MARLDRPQRNALLRKLEIEEIDAHRVSSPDREVALLRVPLWPAGHLPHEGGDWLSVRSSPISGLPVEAPSARSADLPPCGRDVRRDRGGQRRAKASRSK